MLLEIKSMSDITKINDILNWYIEKGLVKIIIEKNYLDIKVNPEYESEIIDILYNAGFNFEVGSKKEKRKTSVKVISSLLKASNTSKILETPSAMEKIMGEKELLEFISIKEILNRILKEDVIGGPSDIKKWISENYEVSFSSLDSIVREVMDMLVAEGYADEYSKKQEIATKMLRINMAPDKFRELMDGSYPASADKDIDEGYDEAKEMILLPYQWESVLIDNKIPYVIEEGSKKELSNKETANKKLEFYNQVIELFPNADMKEVMDIIDRGIAKDVDFCYIYGGLSEKNINDDEINILKEINKKAKEISSKQYANTNKKIKNVTLITREGKADDPYLNKPMVFDSLSEARHWLYIRPRPDSGYYKYDFIVEFTDGTTKQTRYDLSDSFDEFEMYIPELKELSNKETTEKIEIITSENRRQSGETIYYDFSMHQFVSMYDSYSIDEILNEVSKLEDDEFFEEDNFKRAKEDYLKYNIASKETAPFAGYKDFDECVKKNQDKDNPEAYCGSIKHKIEGEKEIETVKEIRYRDVNIRILKSNNQEYFFWEIVNEGINNTSSFDQRTKPKTAAEAEAEAKEFIENNIEHYYKASKLSDDWEYAGKVHGKDYYVGIGKVAEIEKEIAKIMDNKGNVLFEGDIKKSGILR